MTTTYDHRPTTEEEGREPERTADRPRLLLATVYRAGTRPLASQGAIPSDLPDADIGEMIGELLRRHAELSGPYDDRVVQIAVTIC